MGEEQIQTNSMKKEWLKSYVSLRMESERLDEKLARMKNKEKIPARRMGDESKHTGTTGDSLQCRINDRVEYEEWALPFIESARQKMKAIEDAINALHDPLEREVLRMRYIEGEFYKQMPWWKVSIKLFGDDDERHIQATHRAHSKALQHIRGLNT